MQRTTTGHRFTAQSTCRSFIMSRRLEERWQTHCGREECRGDGFGLDDEEVELGHHRAGATPRPTGEEAPSRAAAIQAAPAANRQASAASRRAWLDYPSPQHRGLRRTRAPPPLVRETTRSPPVPPHHKAAQKTTKQKSTSRRPHKTPPQITHPRNSDGRTGSGAHLARIWAESRARRRPPGRPGRTSSAAAAHARPCR